MPSPRVALVTCAELPDLEPDDRLVIGPLAAAGVVVQVAVWDDPSVDWACYDLVVLRSPWDYPPRRDEFVAWAAAVPRLANPADVVAWSTDKRYLAELSAAGVPVVETTWVDPGRPWRLPATGEWVIKPTVGAGSIDSGRYNGADPRHQELARSHVARLHATGRTAMVQPYLSAVDAAGETALLFLDGEYSHAVRKGPMLRGPDAGATGLYQPEDITPRSATPAQRAVAAAALAVIPRGASRLLYARVDLIPGLDGSPQLVELELAEPSLFLSMSTGAADRLTSAILRRLR